MKKIFTFVAATLMAATMFAGRTFTAVDTLYMDCSAVSWWCNDGVSQTMYFVDANSAETSVVGVVCGGEGSKVYAFACPAGEFEYVYEQRGTWNKTGNIALTGTEGSNFIKSFTENGTDVTWGSYDDSSIVKPECPNALYMLGNIENVGWNPGSGIAMTKEGNVFTGVATFVPDGTNTECFFCFTSTNSSSWDDVNASRFGSASQIMAEAAGVALTYPGEMTATIAPGTYTITVDWDSMIVSAESVATALESTKVAQKAQKLIENGQVIFIKNGVRYNALGAAL